MLGTGVADEHGLAEHARRWAARPTGRVAIVLHFSRMTSPVPRPHHRRIAEALMEDVALARDGSLHSLRNGDLALLCATGAAPDSSADAGSLPGVLGRLLRADVADTAAIVSVWPLETDIAQLLLYVRARRDDLATEAASVRAIATPKSATKASETARARDADHASAGVDAAPFARRQMAVSIEPGHGLTPLYREATLPLTDGDVWDGYGSADPFLCRYLAGRLDMKILALATDALGHGGPLDPVADGCPLHLDLTPATVGSAAFLDFAAACVEAGATIGVELSLLDACTDPDGFEAARDILARHGMTLVLDAVSHTALLIARIGALRPDLLKLDWTPALATLGGQDARALDAALRDVGLDRIVLHRAETEAALRWGRAHGIRRFQGRHVDAMLAATRLAACAHAAACTFRQCVDRAGAGTPSGRTGCGDLARLDDRSRIAA